MWPIRHKYSSYTVKRFNDELDQNRMLRKGLKDLALKQPQMRPGKYLAEMMELFNREGLELSLKEMDMLLQLRRKTTAQGYGGPGK